LSLEREQKESPALAGLSSFSDNLAPRFSYMRALPDNEIDASDIPELPAGAWKDAVQGKWYRPVKRAVAIRLDADVLAWLKAKGSGYQTRLNGLLRERMLQETRLKGGR
jgi:uncharacterized protein (DUF4415 family)